MKHFCQFPGWHWWNDIERRYFSYVENLKKTYKNLPVWNWAFFAFAPLCWPWSKITFQHRLDRDWNCMASSYNWEFLGLLLFRNWFLLWTLKLNKYHTYFLFHRQYISNIRFFTTLLKKRLVQSAVVQGYITVIQA